MVEYKYRFDSSVDLGEEARRIYALLDERIPKPKESNIATSVKIGGVIIGLRTPEGEIRRIKTINPSNYRETFLEVMYDTRKRGEVVITSPKLTLADIQRILGVRK